jgi:hypothetical protein
LNTYQNYLEKHFLVDLHELLVPLVDVRSLAAGVIIITGAGRVALVMGAPLNNLLQDGFVDLYQRRQAIRV